MSLTNLLRRLALAVVFGAVLVGPIVATGACAHPNTTQLSRAGMLEYGGLQVVRLVNDATDAVILANKAGKASDALTAQVLTINKQLLDVIQTNPTTWKAIARAALKNALDTLPAAARADVRGYLGIIVDVLGGGV